nr:MAG TPA: anaerobic ribonucleoside triphosphate reductase [Caudoviricetes sp.]
MIKVRKGDGSLERFNDEKIKTSLLKAFESCDINPDNETLERIIDNLDLSKDIVDTDSIQDQLEEQLMELGYAKVAKRYILYRERRNSIRKWVREKEEFISNYKKSSNTADATIDDNSNVSGKNIGILNFEAHKSDNLQVSRGMVRNMLKLLYPKFDAKNYVRDLEHHIIYKNDESSFVGAISPYCCSISMYPFLLEGIEKIGGLSATPKNLDSFCGIYINLIFAVSAMFAGAVATPEFIVYFDYFARKRWGDNYYQNPDNVITSDTVIQTETIRSEIHQRFQQVIYSINQPAAARGLQSASNIVLYIAEFKGFLIG